MPCPDCRRDLVVSWASVSDGDRIIGLAGAYACENCDTFSVSCLSITEPDGDALIRSTQQIMGPSASIRRGQLDG